MVALPFQEEDVGDGGQNYDTGIVVRGSVKEYCGMGLLVLLGLSFLWAFVPFLSLAIGFLSFSQFVAKVLLGDTLAFALILLVYFVAHRLFGISVFFFLERRRN